MSSQESKNFENKIVILVDYVAATGTTIITAARAIRIRLKPYSYSVTFYYLYQMLIIINGYVFNLCYLR